jgi:NADH-quinone oxidoreductase subunit J
MTLFVLCFYLTALLILGAAGLAVTRRHPVQAVVYLIFSFLGTALLFYLLGAPFLAALEAMVYAGAIMILFLFVLMMLKNEVLIEKGLTPGRWLTALILGLLYLVLTFLTAFTDLHGQLPMPMVAAGPGAFGRFIFTRYWLAVEIISLILLVALMAAIQIGKGKNENGRREEKA